MNQPTSSIRCQYCNLLNFASEQFCKRCKNVISSNGSAEANTINININIPGNVQPNFNVNPNQTQFTQKQFTPQMPFENPQAGEYQLQNQTGFQQWQQGNPHNQFNSYNNAPMYPAPMPQFQMPSVWRQGNELVVHRYSGNLPNCCVKCNAPISNYAGGSYVSQKYRWHHPLVYIALISPLIYAILSACLSQRVRVDIPLCNQHLEERKSTGNFLLYGGLGSILAMFFFISFGYVGFSFLIFFAALIAVSIGYEYSYKPLQISKVENDFIFFKKADGEFLNRLPYN